MPYLSAYDDGAFDRIYDGWEFEERHHRERFLSERALRRAEIDAKLPAGNLVLAQERVAALEELAQEFPREARARPDRQWLIWPTRTG